MTTTIQEDKFAKEIDKLSLSLYDKETWTERRETYNKVGIDIPYYDMQCEVFDTLFSQQPDLFVNYQWINDETGMPLWVRPGVEWVPQHELDDDDDDYFYD